MDATDFFSTQKRILESLRLKPEGRESWINTTEAWLKAMHKIFPHPPSPTAYLAQSAESTENDAQPPFLTKDAAHLPSRPRAPLCLSAQPWKSLCQVSLLMLLCLPARLRMLLSLPVLLRMLLSLPVQLSILLHFPFRLRCLLCLPALVRMSLHLAARLRMSFCLYVRLRMPLLFSALLPILLYGGHHSPFCSTEDIAPPSCFVESSPLCPCGKLCSAL